jgi:hypothetical protein
MPPLSFLQNSPSEMECCKKDMFLHVARIGKKRGYLKFS